jgi:hypothetical protein
MRVGGMARWRQWEGKRREEEREGIRKRIMVKDPAPNVCDGLTPLL